jgi:acyl-CoA synthetase (AMP-forming)/AMP-acid ligase II
MSVDSLASAFEHQVLRTPSRIAMRWDAGSKTYEQLHEAMVRRAGVLAWIGLEPGDRLGLALPNGPDYLEIVLAAAHAGIVLVPLDPRLVDSELEGRLDHAGCRALVWVRGVRRMLDRVVEPLSVHGGTGAAAPWAIAYTSGSTGEPKGAILSHLAKLHSATVEAREYGTGEDSVVLVNTPFFHAHALVHAFTALLKGGCVTVARRFDPADTTRVIAEHGVTEISMVPTMYRDMLAINPAPAAFARLRVVRCTGAALSHDLEVALRERFGPRFHVLYGATEAGGVTNLRPRDTVRGAGSVGRPFEGVEIEIRSGLVYTRSPAQFSGYHRGPAHRPGVDWLTLGDRGHVNADGFLYLEGRADDIINSGGENIDPAEVERAIREHPSIIDVAVVGLPDPRLGQSVAAFVVCGPGEAGELDLEGFLGGRIARFKTPRRVIPVGAVPRNAMGKVDREALMRIAASS